MRVQRWAIGGLSAATAVLVAGAVAWACVSGPAVNLSTVNATPGQEVTINGTNFTRPHPVTVRWNALDGPVVETLDPPQNPGGIVTSTFTVPADAKAGSYVVVLGQAGPDGQSPRCRCGLS